MVCDGYPQWWRSCSTPLIFQRYYMKRFLLSLGTLSFIFLSGCGSETKPIDQDKLQQEFNDLQKARQKEDPYAGKRK